MLNSAGFEDLNPAVVPSNLREGSVISNLNVYLEDDDTSAFALQDLVSSSFEMLAAQPGSILDISRISLSITCKYT